MDRELTPEESQRLHELQDALVSEFHMNEEERRAKSAIQDITELKEDALNALRHTIKHSESETLKTKVSMWAYEKILEAEGNGASDPLASLLKDMPTTEKSTTE